MLIAGARAGDSASRQASSKPMRRSCGACPSQHERPDHLCQWRRRPRYPPEDQHNKRQRAEDRAHECKTAEKPAATPSQSHCGTRYGRQTPSTPFPRSSSSVQRRSSRTRPRWSSTRAVIVSAARRPRPRSGRGSATGYLYRQTCVNVNFQATLDVVPAIASTRWLHTAPARRAGGPPSRSAFGG